MDNSHIPRFLLKDAPEPARKWGDAGSGHSLGARNPIEPTDEQITRALLAFDARPVETTADKIHAMRDALRAAINEG